MKTKTFFKLWLKTLAFLSTLMLLGVLFIGATFNWYGKKINAINQEIVVEIPYASSGKSVAGILAQKGLIANPFWFYWYLRFGSLAGEGVQAGYYVFNEDLSNYQLANALRFGRDKAYPITFKEGETLRDLAQSLSNEGLVSEKEFLMALLEKDVLAKVSPPQALIDYQQEYNKGGIEGYLYPNTYFFTKKSTAKDIIFTMHEKLLEKIDEEMHERMHELGLNLHELLTLAAIVEKETAASYERGKVASVYWNRIKKKMKLQADPTVIYGMRNYQGKIGKKDLLTKTPYNTYTNFGLPLGPIGSSSIESLKAVLWPEETNLLFFVSKNDGSHVFCEDLACHNKAVKLWQIDFFRKKRSIERITP